MWDRKQLLEDCPATREDLSLPRVISRSLPGASRQMLCYLERWGGRREEKVGGPRVQFWTRQVRGTWESHVWMSSSLLDKCNLELIAFFLLFHPFLYVPASCWHQAGWQTGRQVARVPLHPQFPAVSQQLYELGSTFLHFFIAQSDSVLSLRVTVLLGARRTRTNNTKYRHSRNHISLVRYADNIEIYAFCGVCHLKNKWIHPFYFLPGERPPNEGASY